MLIWFLGLLLMASLGALGYRQGGIRVACSFLGIVLGAYLAWPLGRLVRPLLVIFGLKNPTLIWLLAPFIVFVLFSVVAKIAALPLHQKADVHFKYHAGELRMALFERLNRRLGLCLGLFNGAAYFILLSFIAYDLGYWTVQLSSEDSDTFTIKLFNRLAKGLDSTGFSKVARAVDPLPQVWFDTADLAGVIYNNPLTEARLSRYPAFLGLAERAEFKDLGADKEFLDMRQRREPIMTVVQYNKVQTILNDPDLLRLIWGILVPDMSDLRAFLETGQSARYASLKIVGRWNLDPNAVVNVFRRLKPNMPSKELQALRRWVASAFEKTSLVAMTDGQALIKNLPGSLRPGPPAATGPQTIQAQWKGEDAKYELSLAIGGSQQECPTTIEGDRLTMNVEGTSLIFTRED